MFNPLQLIFGTKYERDLKKLKPIVEKTNALENLMAKMSDEELKAQTPKLKAKIAEGATLDCNNKRSIKKSDEDAPF